MNAAVRAVVRIGINKGYKVVGISRGYQGLYNEEFREMSAFDVGRFAGICGFSTTENVKADIVSAEMARKRMIYRHSRIPNERDPVTGLPTPEYAANLEKMGAK